MKKILYIFLIILCSMFMVSCKKEEIEPIVFYEDKGDYKTEIPENLDFGMTIDEVKALYGESTYTIDPILISGLKEKNKELLYYKTEYLEKECLLRLSFENDILNSIGYLLSDTILPSDFNLGLRKQIDEHFQEIYGNMSTLDNTPYYLATWNKRNFKVLLFVSDSSEVTEIDDDSPIYIFFQSK